MVSLNNPNFESKELKGEGRDESWRTPEFEERMGKEEIARNVCVHSMRKFLD